MEGSVSEILKRLVTDFNVHTMYALVGTMGVLSALLFFRWIYNKRRFNKLAHQIPASVVKSYLDSIIQNSNSLKSSLFRGDLGVEGIPAVMPVGDLSAGAKVGVDAGTQEALNQKTAEVAALKGKLSEKESLISELETKLASASASGAAADDGAKDAEIAALKEEIERLKAELEAAKANAGAGGGDEALQGQLDAVTKERDELKEKLQEYEIIEDDLANLKRLQQENAELKAQLGGGAAAAAVAAEAPAPTAEPIAEALEEDNEPAPAAEAKPLGKEPEPIAEAVGEDEPVAAAPPAEEGGDPKLEGEEKSAEDLLSEFEKMLG